MPGLEHLYGAGGNDGENPALCAGSSFVCQQPEVTSRPTYTPDPGCDPNASSCGMSATIGMHFPGNHVNAQYFNVGYSFEEVVRTSRPRGVALY